MVDDPPVILRPIVDLDSGAVLAVEAVPTAPPPEEDAAALAEWLSGAARTAAARESLLPLVLCVPARLLTAGREPFTLLVDTLYRRGRRPHDVTLMVGADLRRLSRGHLAAGLGHIRKSGFRCALGTVRVPPDVLAEAAPFLLRIDSALVAGLGGDERSAAIVEGMVRVGRGTGAFPLACGVSAPEQVASLLRSGVRLAQGPLFADDAWEPGERVTAVPAPSLETRSPVSDSGPRVAEFLAPAVTMAEEATSEEVLEAFSNDSALNSVVLTDHRERPVAALDRARFLLAITGPYGHALHARRPARRLADPPRTVPRGTPAMSALRVAGADRERVYDDLVAVNEFGQCMGVVHVGDIIRGLSRV